MLHRWAERLPTRDRTWALVAVGVVLTVTATTLLVTRTDDEVEAPDVDWSALPAVAATPPEAPAAPDPADVRSALGSIDVCAVARLLRQQVVRGAEVRAVYGSDRAGCTVRTERTRVEVAVERVDASSSGFRRIDLAGRAARVQIDETDYLDRCTIQVPVGPDLGLRVGVADNEAPGGIAQNCTRLEAPLARVVTALARPASQRPFRLAPARPFACDLVEEVDLPGRWVDAGPAGCVDGDRYSARSARSDDSTTVSLSVTSDGAPAGTAVALPGAPGGTARLLRDVQDDYAFEPLCAVRWRSPWRQFVGDDSDSGPLAPLDVTVAAPVCDDAQRLAAVLVGAQRWRPRTSPPSPTSFMYDADGPDRYGPPGCDSLFSRSEQCVPAREVEAPDDPVALIRRGEADPDVVCAAALPVVERSSSDSVATTVESRLVTSRGRVCRVVEPGRGNAVTVEVSREPVGKRDDRLPDIAGHPAFGTVGTGRVTVALGDPDERGTLTIEVQGDRDFLATSDDVVEALVERFLG